MRQTLIKDGSFVLLKTHQLEIPKESVCILVKYIHTKTIIVKKQIKIKLIFYRERY